MSRERIEATGSGNVHSIVIDRNGVTVPPTNLNRTSSRDPFHRADTGRDRGRDGRGVAENPTLRLSLTRRVSKETSGIRLTANATQQKTITVNAPISRRTNDPCQLSSTTATTVIETTVTVKTSKNVVGRRTLGSRTITGRCFYGAKSYRPFTDGHNHLTPSVPIRSRSLKRSEVALERSAFSRIMYGPEFGLA